MPRLRFLDSARNNLADIENYIATAGGGEDVAVRFTGEIIAKCEHLAALTGLVGRARLPGADFNVDNNLGIIAQNSVSM